MKRSPSPETTRWDLRAVVFLAAAVCIVYAGSLTAPFVFDDMHTIVHNSYIKSVSRAGALFTKPLITSVTTILPNMFRPLLMLSYAVNYATSGLNPVGYHVVNLWLHLLNALLVYALIAQRLGGARWAALGCALLFAVHPLNSQAVIHISSRSTLFATTWMLAGCLAYRMPGAVWPRWLTVIAYAGGLLTKEIAITLPILWLWLDWVDRRRARWRQTIDRVWPCAVLLVLYLWWRHRLFGAVGSPVLIRDWWLNLGVACQAVFLYLRLWLWPVGLCIAREMPVPPMTGDIAWWLPVAGYAGLWVTALWCAWRGRARALALGLGWFLIALVPSHPIATLNLPAGENHSYLPSIGWFLALSALVATYRWGDVERHRRRLMMVGGVVSVVFAILTMQRVSLWRDRLRFWEAAARCAPHTSGVWVSVAQEHEARGDAANALELYQRALALARTTVEEAQVRTNLGTLYWRTGRLIEARKQLMEAITIDPRRVEAYNNLGLVEEGLHQLDAAKQAYQQALALAPRFPDPAQNLGVLALRAQRWDEAITDFRAAIASDPDRLNAYIGLGEAYEGAGDDRSALVAYEFVQRYAPRDSNVAARLDRVRQRLRDEQ